MHVLQHEHQWLLGSRGCEPITHLGEQSSLVGDSAQSARDGGPGVATGSGHALQNLGPRAVRRGFGQVVTVAGRHPRAAGLGFTHQIGHQCGLADAGLPADQDKASARLECRGEAVTQSGLLAGATGEDARSYQCHRLSSA